MRLHSKLLDTLGVLAAFAYAAAALATTADVIARNAAGFSMRGLVDVIEYGLFVSTFLAAPWVLRMGGHVRVDFLLRAVAEPARVWLERAGNLIGLLVCVVFLVYSWQVTATAFDRGTLVFKSIVFPEWWVLSVLPVSSALCAAEFLRRMVTGRDGDGSATS